MSRVDEVIVFRPLDVDDYTKIAKLLMEEYVGSLKERNITLTYDDKAARWLAEHSIGGKSGARDLRNLIRREVEDKLASVIVNQGEGALTAVAVTADENGIQVQTI